MLFTEINFVYFIFVVVALQFVGNNTYKKVVLLSASYFFYGYWDWRFLSLIWISTIVDFMVGKAIYSSFDHKKRKRLLFISIFTNLSILGFFKYFNFFIDSFNYLTDRPEAFNTLHIILPIGISFYTFQTMSYTIDIYRNKLRPTKSILDFSNFVAFFPQLVAGPIERAKNLLPQMEKYSGVSSQYLKKAIILIFLGYVKKVFIADNIAPIVNHHFENYMLLNSFETFYALYLFSFQIYFDFSGYSDIARGLALLFGVNLIENFNQPYFSKSPTEFWSRWHISLSTWLKDYLYIPLGGNQAGLVRTNINLMATMLLGGLWHGASWNFVLWGGLHGFYLILNKIIRRYKAQRKSRRVINNFTPIKILFTYLLILITWLPFRSNNLDVTISIFSNILNFTGNVSYSNVYTMLFLFVLLLSLDLPAYFLGTHLFLLKIPKMILTIIIAIVTIFGIMITLFLNPIDTARPFIYFQF